jgi:hypothetical protein
VLVARHFGAIKSRRMRSADSGNIYRIRVGKTEWMILLRRQRRRWEENIKTDLKKYNVRCGLD